MCRMAAEDLAREIVMLNFAATENSSYLLCNAIMLLAQHPEWLDAIYEEQKVLMDEYGPDNWDRRVRSRTAFTHGQLNVYGNSWSDHS